ncbi:MAG: RNA polymerase sigma factor [Candidatus Pacebacteria bacterium]|nr:RNA polymerase sigma factor [Candidatus Paceibacterota bacterium]
MLNNTLTFMTIEEKITQAYNDYQKGLSKYSFSKLNNRAIGEDLVQDTFMKTWTYLVKGGKIDAMKAFLFHVLNNLIVDQYRKKKTASLDVLMEAGFEPKAPDSERLFNTLDGKAAQLLIEKLPSTYQKVMRMRYIQDLSLSEMSHQIGQSKNAIAVQLHRGLEKLKVLHEHRGNY